MSTKSLMVASTAAVLAMVGTGSANAHGHKGFNNFQHGPHVRFVVTPNYGGGCGYYYDRWQYTGSYYWKKQYFVCKGWW